MCLDDDQDNPNMMLMCTYMCLDDVNVYMCLDDDQDNPKMMLMCTCVWMMIKMILKIGCCVPVTR